MRLSRVLALLSLVPLFACAHGAPRRLASPQALLAALEDGRAVHVTVRYARCVLVEDGQERPAPDAIGGFTVAAFEHFARGVVRNERAYTALSETRLIVHPRHGPVQNYARLRVHEDGDVEVGVKYLAPPDLRPVMEETFRCRLGEAVSFTAGR